MDLCAIGDLSWLILLSVPHIPLVGEILRLANTQRLLGNDAAMVSLQAARLGMRVRLIATNSISLHDGQPLLERLQQEGVNVSQIDTSGNVTPATIFLSRIASDERVGLVEPYPFHCMIAPDWLPDSPFAYIDLYDERFALLQRLSQAHVHCLVNLSSSRLEDKIALLASVPSLEIIQVRGTGGSDEAFALGHRILQTCHVRAVVITLGGSGTVLVEQHNALFIAAEAIKPVQTIGAGASFSAGFLFAMMQGAIYSETATFASKYAAAFCSSQHNPFVVIKH
jgi:sugar/nucleoside kinase (ribokinase family)